jgi:hypothetical protein
MGGIIRWFDRVVRLLRRTMVDEAMTAALHEHEIKSARQCLIRHLQWRRKYRMMRESIKVQASIGQSAASNTPEVPER